MLYSIRAKLIAGFIGVSVIVGAFSTVVGNRLLHKSVFNEAAMRVSLDLNSAMELYRSRMMLIEASMNVTTLGYGFIASLKENDIPDLIFRLERMSNYANLDFAGIADRKGALLCRTGPNSVRVGNPGTANPIVLFSVKRGVPVSGTVVLSRDFLLEEDPRLLERGKIVDPPRGDSMDRAEESAALSIAAAVPVVHEGEILGILYGGVLLNGDEKVVDSINDSVFHNERYKGRSIGRAALFLGDFQISPRAAAEEDSPGVRTTVSETVKEQVLAGGRRWTDRVRMEKDWYLFAYEPIKDIYGRTAGFLGIGVLEEKYADMRWKALFTFISITALGMLIAVLLGYLLTARLTRPIRRLIKASRQVTEGSLTPELGPLSDDEIGVLQKAFQEMVAAMGRRRAESQNRLIMSEKQASVGRLAAGVAHEINNPLTGVLTYTHLLLRRKDLSEGVRADLHTIVEATERVRKIVKGLLDFSRQSKPDREQVDVNQLVRSTVALVENQALVKGVSLQFEAEKDLSRVNMDRSQFQSVLLNILINGLDATKPGDVVRVTTRNSGLVNESGQEAIEISIADNGCGIPQDHLNKIFDPFFTTKEVGQGTGLGLAVSLGIVQRHGGSIRVQSEVGKGSTFTIRVPLEGRVA